jgi:hypothetical protein
MKHALIIVLSVAALSQAAAQTAQPPFIFSLYGGLFFPSNLHFKEIYQSTSERIWGVGVCLPVAGSLFLTGDIAYFRAEGFIGSPTDSGSVLEQKFIHAGIISKQPLGAGFLMRLSGGLNYVTVKETRTGSASVGAHSIEADRSIGYYGGIGMESFLDQSGKISLFGDVIYDYRRSHQEDLYGDFGGVRTVLGVHLYLF